MSTKLSIESLQEMRRQIQKHPLVNPSGVCNINGDIIFFGPYAENVKNDFVAALKDNFNGN